MHDKDRQDILNEMANAMQQRQKQRDQIRQQVIEFTEKLFDGLENAATQARQAEILAYGPPKRLPHPAAQELSILQLFIEDWKVVLVPMIGAARPAFKDEAQIPGAKFKELSGRIVVYIGDNPSTGAFYDFLIFTDHSWFAWGYGWPRQSDDIDHTDFEQLGFELLLSFGRDIYKVWSTRAETQLKMVVDKTNPAYEFRVLRDDEKK
jgi:hypothetical protein